MKQKLLYFFAAVGIIGLVSKAVGFYRNEQRTGMYWKNCEKVKVGMTLHEARQIVGDLEYQYWTQDSKSAEIIVYQTKDEATYTLEYDMVFAGSDNMKIQFDPITLRVTNVFCGE